MRYPDTHPLSGAFLANRLNHLADLISLQGDELLNEAGLDMPSRTVSLMLLVGERGQLSAADAASLLGQPHQLVTQRIEALLDLDLIVRQSDSGDGRRKILMLSENGKDQYARLGACLLKASNIFDALFSEIECDLSNAAGKAVDALNSMSLLQRMNCSFLPDPKSTNVEGGSVE